MPRQDKYVNRRDVRPRAYRSLMRQQLAATRRYVELCCHGEGAVADQVALEVADRWALLERSGHMTPADRESLLAAETSRWHDPEELPLLDGAEPCMLCRAALVRGDL